MQFGAPAVAYWDGQEASDNGVLGGYGHLSGPDVRDSRAFLKKVRRPSTQFSSCCCVASRHFPQSGQSSSFAGHSTSAGWSSAILIILQAYGAALTEAETGQRQLVALDCGAGVGRVTEQLLLHHCAEVDLVEPSGVGLSCRPPGQFACTQSAFLQHSSTVYHVPPHWCNAHHASARACSPSAGGSKAAAGRACSEGGATRPQSSQFLPGKLLMLA